MGDDRLEAVLTSVGEHLVVDADVGRAVAGRPGRWLAAAAVVVAVVAGALALVAPARDAVGDWFRAGRIEVELTRDTAIDGSLGVLTDVAEPIDPAAVEDILGVNLPYVTGSSLGAPGDWWTIPEGGVVAGWADGTTLWLSTEQGGDLGKQAADPSAVVPLDDLGDGGFAMTGDHLLVTPHRRVASQAAVVWVDGGLTFRVEGPGDVERLIDIARQFAE